ncbi:Na+/H+ antiporter subunit E [Thiogranum longum]
MNNLRHAFNLGIFLFAMWLLLSGHYTSMLLGLGMLSVVFVVLITLRVNLVDRELHPLLIKPSALWYSLWLSREIVKSNIDVARRILDPRLPISPNMLEVKATQRTELGRVSYANSITLVPGTVSMNVENDIITVHALTLEAAADLRRGEMDRRVREMERVF